MWLFWYLSWLPLAVIGTLGGILAYPLVPIAVLFRKGDHLPWCFRWLETFDNPIYGEPSHYRRWAAFVAKNPSIGEYVQIVAWLWRNKAYNLDYWLCGRQYSGPFKLRGDPFVESGSPVAHPGWVLITTATTWGFFAFIPHLKIGGYQYYFRIYLGWKTKKLGQYPETNERAMLGTHINPFRRIKLE